MRSSGHRRAIEVYGGDIVAVGDRVTCYLVMERVDMTLGGYLKQQAMGLLEMQKCLEVTSELLDIARFLGDLELCHSDIKVCLPSVNLSVISHYSLIAIYRFQTDNIVCSKYGTRLRLIDWGQSCSWKKRQGCDVVRDGSKSKPQWDARYHQVSCKNNTPDADASVDQYSIAIVMVQVLLGRAHPLYKHAVTQRKVRMIAVLAYSCFFTSHRLHVAAPLSIKVDLDKRLSNFVTSPRERTVFPIVKLLKRTIEDERQMNFDALETALAAAMTELPRPIPVPCLTSKKGLVSVGRGHT